MTDRILCGKLVKKITILCKELTFFGELCKLVLLDNNSVFLKGIAEYRKAIM